MSQPAVLYVEDDPSSRAIMKLLLKGRMGLTQTTIFEDSHDFITRVEALNPKPEIIFLDIHIQPVGGFQMLEQLRSNPKFQDTPIVALTASVMNEEVQELKQSGFNGCLAKPVNVDTFPDTLNRILNGEEIWLIT